MSYLCTLKQLREKMAQRASGSSEQESSLVPMRYSQEAPVAPTEDILARSASWLSQIREGAQKIQQSAPEVDTSGTIKLASAIGSAIGGKKRDPQEQERYDSFIQRRKDKSPSTFGPERAGEEPPIDIKAVPIDAEVKDVLEAIAFVESRGSGDYVAKGPVVGKGRYKGQRAYGRYQVMEGNIGPWTKEVFGKPLSKEQFLASPEAQDAVAAHQLSKSKKKFGSWEDAASVWFSGRPVKQAGNASDGYTTVPEYIAKFRRGFKRSNS